MSTQIEQELKIINFRIGEIVRYTGYEGDLINNPNKKPIPNKFFKIKTVDMDWGTVNHGNDTIGISNIRRTNFLEKIKWILFWKN